MKNSVEIVSFNCKYWLERYIKRTYPEIYKQINDKYGDNAVRWAEVTIYNNYVHLIVSFTSEAEYKFGIEGIQDLFGKAIRGEYRETFNKDTLYFTNALGMMCYVFYGASMEKIIKSCDADGNYHLM